MTNYFQNHRRYVKSIAQEQLKGRALSYSALESGDCRPVAVDTVSRLPIYPCGLIANSVFNGAFIVPPSWLSLTHSTLRRHLLRTPPAQSLLTRFSAHLPTLQLHLHRNLLARRSGQIRTNILQRLIVRSAAILGRTLSERIRCRSIWNWRWWTGRKRCTGTGGG